jgi:hypothetical protein
MSKLVTTRSVKWTVGAFDEPVHSDALTCVEIADEGEGAGEFVQVSQSDEDGLTTRVKISPEEWPELMSAIDHAIKMCQEMPK